MEDIIGSDGESLVGLLLNAVRLFFNRQIQLNERVLIKFFKTSSRKSFGVNSMGLFLKLGDISFEHFLNSLGIAFSRFPETSSLIKFSAFLKNGSAMKEILLARKFKSTTVEGILQSVSILQMRLLFKSIRCSLKHLYMLSGKAVIWLLLKLMTLIRLQLRREGTRVILLFQKLRTLRWVRLSKKSSSNLSIWLSLRLRVWRQCCYLSEVGTIEMFILAMFNSQRNFKSFRAYKLYIFGALSLRFNRFNAPNLPILLGNSGIFVLERSNFYNLVHPNKNFYEILSSIGLFDSSAYMSSEQLLSYTGNFLNQLLASSMDCIEVKKMPKMEGREESLLSLSFRSRILLHRLKVLGREVIQFLLSYNFARFLQFQTKISLTVLILLSLRTMVLREAGHLKLSQVNELESNCSSWSSGRSAMDSGIDSSLFLLHQMTLSFLSSLIQSGSSLMLLLLMPKWCKLASCLNCCGTSPSLFLVRSRYSNLVMVAKDCGNSLRLSWLSSNLLSYVSWLIYSGKVLNLLFLMFKFSNLLRLQIERGRDQIKLSLTFSISRFQRVPICQIFTIWLRLSTNLLRLGKLSHIQSTLVS